MARQIDDGDGDGDGALATELRRVGLRATPSRIAVLGSLRAARGPRSHAEVAEDLRDAKVYVFVPGSEDDINKALKTLQHAATFVRQQVAMNLDLRHAPHVHFMRDTAEENAARVSEILNTLDINKESSDE